MIQLVILTPILAGTAAAVAAIVASIRHDDVDDHPGATETTSYADLRGDTSPARRFAADDTALLAPVGRELVRPYVLPRGRHRRETAGLDWRPAGWRPPVGSARIHAALDETAEMEAIR